MNKTGCPYCVGRKVLVGFNDCVTTYPMLAKEWHPTKNGNSSTEITITTEGVEHLKNIISRLEKIQGVFSVERINK